MTYYSQSNQDKWVVESLKGKKNGFFVDIGAYDGIQTSNTYVLEKELGWNGICIEGNAAIFNRLQQNRKSINLNIAVSDKTGECHFGEDSIVPFGVKVKCDTLDNILRVCNAPTVIDYLSIDIEGFEYTVLKDFPFKRWKIGMMTVEHNSYKDGPAKKNQLFELLIYAGFIRVIEDAKCLDPHPSVYKKPYEDWYVNENFKDFLPK